MRFFIFAELKSYESPYFIMCNMLLLTIAEL